MLLLVLTDGNQIGLVKKDICRHQYGIIVKTCVYVICMLCGFILKLGHTVKLAYHCVAIEHPAQLCVSGNVAL